MKKGAGSLNDVRDRLSGVETRAAKLETKVGAIAQPAETPDPVDPPDFSVIYRNART